MCQSNKPDVLQSLSDVAHVILFLIHKGNRRDI